MIIEEKWVADQGEYIFEILQAPRTFIELECSEANTRETGGILIGYYSEDRTTAIVTEATSAPRDSLRGNTWFQRGVAGLKTLLAYRWKNTNRRTYYIGEWHFHPTTEIVPSDDDFKQMHDISTSTNYHCSEPIMLIVGKNVDDKRPVRVFVFPSGKKQYEYHRITTKNKTRP